MNALYRGNIASDSRKDTISERPTLYVKLQILLLAELLPKNSEMGGDAEPRGSGNAYLASSRYTSADYFFFPDGSEGPSANIEAHSNVSISPPNPFEAVAHKEIRSRPTGTQGVKA